jgi:hypothetical protein
MTSELADRILLWSYSDTDAYTLENCDWYSGNSIEHLHFWAKQFIEDQLYEFYADFSEWFNSADFPDVEEQLEPSEKAVFLKAAGAPDDWAPNPDDASSMDDYDSFSGLRAVIRHRLDQRSLEQIKLAADLFNWTIEFGLFCCDTEAHAVLRVGSVEEVAPFLLKRILNRLPNEAQQRDPRYRAPPSAFEQRFLPLAPMLTMLRKTVGAADWVQNELALSLFFWIAEMYKVQVERNVG